jgi:hypothetical protein
MVDASGMPISMCVAWFSPSDSLSRITAHDASFETVDSMPNFLKYPSSWAMTIGEQSVRRDDAEADVRLFRGRPPA